MEFIEEALMAYADGELDAATAARVEAAIGGDSRIAERIVAHRAVRARLQAAYAADLRDPVPQRLVDAAMRSPPSRDSSVVPLDAARKRRIGASWRPALPLAAAASLMLGVGIGFLAWHSSGPLLGENARGAVVANGRLAHALSSELSRPGARGGIDMVLSFVDKSGAYCRAFRIAGADAPAGLACRRGAQWGIDVLAPSAVDQGTDSGYRTAGSSLPPAVLQTVQSQIADQPLDRAGEIAARGRGWKKAPSPFVMHPQDP